MISYAPAPNPIDPMGGDSLEELRRRKMLAELLQGRRNRQPVITSPTQGIAHVLDSAMEGFQESRERRRAEAQRRQDSDLMGRYAAVLGGGNTPAPAAPAAPFPSPSPAPGPTASAPGEIAIPQSLIANESGGRWDAQNNVMGAGGQRGHFGRLQFGQARLAEAMAAGAIPPGTTPQAFMASPDLQRAAEQWHFRNIDEHIERNGLGRFIGQNVGGAPVTQEGMRAVAHLGGNAGLTRFLETGGRYNPADANGTRLSDYLARHGRPADRVTGSDGMDEAPLIDGRFLPPDEPLPVPATPLDAAGPAEPPLIDGRSLPPDPPLPPQALARALMEAPAPEPRPNMEAPAAPVAPPQEMQAAPVPPAPVMPPQAAPELQGPPMPDMMAGGAPVPMPRPDIAPPPQAAPAGPAPAGPPPQALARALQMPERDRLMLMRDEGSLAPGEAEALRSGVPNNQAIAAVLQGQPIPRPAPVSAPMAAPAGPAPMPGQAPAPVQASPDQRMAVLQDMVRSNNPQLRQMALAEFQRIQAQNTPQAQAALAKTQAEAELARQQVEGRNATDDERNYRNYIDEERAAGRTPLSRFEWGQQRRRAAANNTTVSVTQKAEEAEAAARGKGLAERLNAVATAGNQAAESLAVVNRIGDLMGAVDPGARTAALEAIRRSTGIALDPNASTVQATEAAIRYLQPRMRVEGSGATSDRDMAAFEASLPSLRGTTDGNRLVLQTLGGVFQHQAARAEIARRYQNGTLTGAQADEEMAKLPDPYAAFKSWRDQREGRTGQDAPQRAPAQAAPAMPSVGDQRRGWRYKGGDPSQPSSWERVE